MASEQKNPSNINHVQFHVLGNIILLRISIKIRLFVAFLMNLDFWTNFPIQKLPLRANLASN